MDRLTDLLASAGDVITAALIVLALVLWAVLRAAAAAIIGPLLEQEVIGWTPRIATALLVIAARRFPTDHRDEALAELQAEMDTLRDRPLTALLFGIGHLLRAPRTAQVLAQLPLPPAASETDDVSKLLPLGSLADLLTREAGPDRRLPLSRARDLVRALNDALDYWENTIQHRQIDLSPDNVLIRRAHPPELVLADLGGVKATDVSQQQVVDILAKVSFMAPEALANRQSSKSSFWSLGAIAHQLVTGHSILGDGLVEHLAVGEPDLSAVQDESWSRLLAGLLTRDPRQRWGSEQVREWLAGGRPEVHRSR